MTELMMNQQQKQLKIILIGDHCEDIYSYGEVKRISPEAPVPVFSFVREEKKPGMAANVKMNLENLGCEVLYIHGNKSIKTRVIDLHTKQHLIRIDEDLISDPLNIDDVYLFDADAIVLADYDKGLLTYDNMQRIIHESGKKQIPVFIDTKKRDLKKLEGSYVKINELEYENAISLCEDLIITRGGKDVLFYDTSYPVKDIDVIDVCGAGDTFMSAFVYKTMTDKCVIDAINFAIAASAVTVKHFGVYAPTLEEILCQKHS